MSRINVTNKFIQMSNDELRAHPGRFKADKALFDELRASNDASLKANAAAGGFKRFLHCLPPLGVDDELVSRWNDAVIGYNAEALRVNDDVSNTLFARGAAGVYCSICFKRTAEGDSINVHRGARAPLEHSFHIGCIMLWVEYSTACPVCHVSIL